METNNPTTEQVKDVHGMLHTMQEAVDKLTKVRIGLTGSVEKIQSIGDMFKPIGEKKILINGNEVDATLMKNGTVILKFKELKDAELFYNTHK